MVFINCTSSFATISRCEFWQLLFMFECSKHIYCRFLASRLWSKSIDVSSGSYSITNRLLAEWRWLSQWMQLLQLKNSTSLFSGHTSCSTHSLTANHNPNSIWSIHCHSKVHPPSKSYSFLSWRFSKHWLKMLSISEQVPYFHWIQYLPSWFRWFANEYLFPCFISDYLVM